MNPFIMGSLLFFSYLLLLVEKIKTEHIFEYFPSTSEPLSEVLKKTLSNEDFLQAKVKILPDDQDVVFQLRYGQKIK